MARTKSQQNDQICFEKIPNDQRKFLDRFAETFQENSQELAIQVINRFFEDKMFFIGGKIPKNLLFDKKAISMVLNFDVSHGVELAHESLPKKCRPPKYDSSSKKSYEPKDDVDFTTMFILDLLKLIEKSGVPQQFVGGIMCLYILLVEGHDIGKYP